MPDPERYPSPADFEQFVRDHENETWLLAPVLEETRCRHGGETFVPYGDTLVGLNDWYPCEPCLHADLLGRAEYLYGEGLASFDPTNTHLEYTP
jgi:hypothetical protein